MAGQPELLAGELDDRVVQQAELAALLPAALGDRRLIIRKAGCQRQQQRQRMLRDRRRAVRLAIAHGYAQSTGGSQVDVVDARGGDQNQLQVRAGGKRLVAHRDLVDDGHLGTAQSLDDVLCWGLLVTVEGLEGIAQGGEIQVALVERGEVEKDGAF